MIIYYNPDCSKCREAKDLLETNNCTLQIREYLKEPPSIAELGNLLRLLNINAFDLVRTSEPLYKEKFEGKTFSDEQWIRILNENPLLIQRPIIIDGTRAIIGRPPTLVLELVRK